MNPLSAGRRSRRCSSLLMMLPLLLIADQASATETVRSFNVVTAVQQALTENRLLSGANSAVDAASAGKRQAEGSRLPRLNVESSIMHSNSPMAVFGNRLLQQSITAADFAPATLNYPSALTHYQSRINLDVPIYRGGALAAAISQADAQLNARQHDVDRVRQHVIYQVLAAYSDALRAEASKLAAEQATAAAKSHHQTAERMFGKGMLLQSDVMDAHVHLLNAEIAVTQTGYARNHAEDRLHQLLALNMNQKLDLAPWPNSSHPMQDTHVLLEQARNNRPELHTMKAELEQSKAVVASTQAAFKPELSLQLGQEWNNNTLLPKHGNTTASAVMRWNLFAGGADRAASDAAEARLTMQQIMLTDLQQGIVVEVLHARRQLMESASRLHVRKLAREQASESLRIHRLRFNQGMENINSMLDAQTRLNKAEDASVQARFDHQMARIHLLLSTGTLNLKALKE